ncbi:MAG: hypothetical protein WCF03_20135 [Nitrososphaeraceae archaeon]
MKTSYFDNLEQQATTNKNEPLDKLLQKAKGLDFNDFWDLLGRPTKHGKKLGVLDYQNMLVQTLE